MIICLQKFSPYFSKILKVYGICQTLSGQCGIGVPGNIIRFSPTFEAMYIKRRRTSWRYGEFKHMTIHISYVFVNIGQRLDKLQEK